MRFKNDFELYRKHNTVKLSTFFCTHTLTSIILPLYSVNGNLFYVSLQMVNKMQLMLLILGFSLYISCASELQSTPADQDKPKIENDGIKVRKQDTLAEEKTGYLNGQAAEPTNSTEADSNKGKLQDMKGESAELTKDDKQENGKDEKNAKDNINDDLQYLSAAQGDDRRDHEHQEETTENNEHSEDMSHQEGDDTNEDEMEDPEEDEKSEQDNSGENEDDEKTDAPLDKKNKKQVVLGRGFGSLADMMFQYATVSSIARSSKRRAIFSSAFTPLLTIFPKAPIVIIEDEEVVQLQPLTNITLSNNQISFDSVKQDIPDEGSVEIVGQTKSWKYFHVILNNLRNELSPAQFYIEAADDYLEEVMRRALKNKTEINAKEDKKEELKTGEEDHIYGNEGFLKYNKKEDKRDEDKDMKKGEGKAENVDSKSNEEEPKSIIEQMKSPGDEITLVGIHIPATFSGDDKESDKQQDTSNDDTKLMEEKRKQKEKAVLEYFTSAMEYYRDEHSTNGDYVQFVIVCEDLRWCIGHFNGPGVHFAIGGSSELDMSILARCDHSILTSSSLSWWSSWQAGGQVVYPTTLSEMNGVSIEDYVFPDWAEI